MPQGRCSSSGPGSDFPIVGFSRIAQITAQFRGVRRTIHLAGMADAHFPDREPQDNSELVPGQVLRMVWLDAVFHGSDALLGPMTASIPRGAGASGVIRSLSSAGSTTPGSTDDFFPAVNDNAFSFGLSIPRLGLQLISNRPVENSAEIREIPPVGAVYRLKDRVTFRAAVERSNWLLSAATGPIVITECNIKLVLVGGIELGLQGGNLDGETVTFSATARNVTPAEYIKATWLVWPRPDDESMPTMGTISLGRAPKTFRLRLPRDIFYTRRWLVLCGAKPFTLDEAAAGVRFPPLA